MSVGSWITIIGVVVTLLTLGTLMLSNTRRLEAKIDAVAQEVIDLRVAVRVGFAQHDVRLTTLEQGQHPRGLTLT